MTTSEKCSRLHILLAVSTLFSCVCRQSCSAGLKNTGSNLENIGFRQARRPLPVTEYSPDCHTTSPRTFKQRFRQYDPNTSVFIIPVEKPVYEDNSFKAWGGKRSKMGTSLPQDTDVVEYKGAGWSGKSRTVKKSYLDKQSSVELDSSQINNSHEHQPKSAVRIKNSHKFLSWGGKRSDGSFGHWGGKRSGESLGQYWDDEESGLAKRTSFNNWGGKRDAQPK